MLTAKPTILIFDVDGVLVDVAGSFHRTVLQTVRHFTCRCVSDAEIHAWKNRPGFNDDWKLCTSWIRTLGRRKSFADVKAQFEKFYWGENGREGNVMRERWILRRPLLRRWSRRAELALFTGRTRQELHHTLERFRVADFFARIVTAEDVLRGKPHPEGLQRILDGRDPTRAIYVGDNTDDALAAKRIGIPFVGVLPRNSLARRIRAARLQQLGAKTILGTVNELARWLED